MGAVEIRRYWHGTSEPALPECIDGIDNDGDGFTDFGDDPECADRLDDREAAPWCGLGFDLALLLPLLMGLRRRRGRY